MSNQHHENDDRLYQHLLHCQQVADEMKRRDEWLWPDEPDSPNSEDVVDSNNPTSEV